MIANLFSSLQFRKVRNALLFVFAFVFISSSCNQNKHSKDSTADNAKLKEHLMNANKIFNATQLDNIDEYVQRHNLQMDTTQTGLRIKINKTGSGIFPAQNNLVEIKYSLTLLDGTEISDNDSLTFSMSHDAVPNGLREAVSMMRIGDIAMAILPSYLAYGIIGDGDKIPSHAALIYRIELLKIE